MLISKNKQLVYITFVMMLFGVCCVDTHPKTKVIFFGDSITFYGRWWHDGYINIMDSLIKKERLTNKYQLESEGAIADKIFNLYNRLDKDVLQYNPDVVVILVGVNDVAFRNPTENIASFKDYYTKIIKTIQDKNIKIILCTPPLIGELKTGTNPKDKELNNYCEAIKGIAKSKSLPLCDLRTEFVTYLQNNNPNNLQKGILTFDGMHLTKEGNALAANSLWKIIKEIKK